MQPTNTIVLEGIVSGAPEMHEETVHENIYRITIDVPRLSGIVDRLPVLVGELLCDPAVIAIGDPLRVEGQVRTHNRIENGKPRVKIDVFALGLEYAGRAENPNVLALNGFICKKPIHRHTPLGREIADFVLAVNRPYGQADYIPCITWGSNARRASKLYVGDELSVVGRLQSREYTKLLEDGTEKTMTTYEASLIRWEKR